MSFKDAWLSLSIRYGYFFCSINNNSIDRIILTKLSVDMLQTFTRPFLLKPLNLLRRFARADPQVLLDESAERCGHFQEYGLASPCLWRSPTTDQFSP